MKMIRLGNNLSMEGDASPRLLKCLSGCQFPLAGVAETPYVRGSEILEKFSDRLHDPKVCYLVKKDQIIQVLRKISPAAVAEIREKYFDLTYLPFRRRSCKILM